MHRTGTTDCLDAYLGDDFFTRLVNYYRLEWGQDAAPTDPNAPQSRRAGYGPAAQPSPPYPFTEWPYGGATPIAVSLPNSVNSPLMKALSPTPVGKFLEDNHIQVYGWIDPGFNISNARSMPGALAGGNSPAAYSYQPNLLQLDQAVVIVERVPDTVQTDHWDWGFRLSPIYGETYRYTTANGFFSKQLLKWNEFAGYDMPMYYGEVYIPNIMDGLIVRFGRYISMPDIEAQLAPNNYMYSHSMTYVIDGYTNQGAAATLQVNKNWFVQAGVVIGSDTAAWRWGETVANPFPNPVFPGTTMPRDPGAQPSVTAAIRYQSDSGRDAFYITANGINNGTWGYDNLQWFGGTYYHKFNDQWHLSFEAYTLGLRNVLNGSGNNALANAIIANNGYPFTLANGFNFNAPFFAQCNPSQVTCTAQSYAALFYLNYKFSALDNVSLRGEFYDDMEGQRTGTKTRYLNWALGSSIGSRLRSNSGRRSPTTICSTPMPSTATSMRYRRPRAAGSLRRTRTSNGSPPWI